MSRNRPPRTVTEYLEQYRGIILAAVAIILHRLEKNERATAYLVAYELLALSIMRPYAETMKPYRVEALVSTAGKFGAFAEFDIVSRRGVGFVLDAPAAQQLRRVA